MAITVDYSTQPYVIEFKQADLTLVEGTRYQITVDFMWQLLREYDDNVISGMAYPTTYRRIPATASTPPITEINDIFYLAQFENGNYSVDIIDGNTNFRDVEVKNNVSVGTNNTTGFINPTFLEAAVFSGRVVIDQANGVAGTGTAPDGSLVGTLQTPVNNLTDAKSIAVSRGIRELLILGTFTFLTTDTLDGYIVNGPSAAKATCVLTPAATIQNCIFRELTLTGELDGGNDASFCIIAGLNYIDGSLLDCLLSTGDIVLGGTQANFLRCASAIAGGGPGQTPMIDMDGGGTDIIVRDYHGGIEFKNSSSSSEDVSIDMSSGRVIIDSDVTAGTFVIRGVSEVEDNSTGTAVVDDRTLDPIKLAELWTHLGLDADNPATITPTTQTAGAISIAITGDGETTTTLTRS